ncbi:hypothetical protein MUB24_15655 [Lederbergia sp. NSJ-179]|uniref:hypothetical protein n=1 Tax=Lederbergia sp. NSJ-179 TaxID=2931402 RepID=UPI001FD33F04|nr:hypothetical protein [Lederbergia sp. NSJ-179]MCJ7842304.1 hypothetical protein [Lederbergia sp. NSJ-179]
MKNKKYLLGGVITGGVLITILVFNSFVFPSVLAATSQDSEIKTIPASKVESESTTEQVTDPSNDLKMFGITDGVSEQMALQIAIDALKETKDVSNLPYAINIAQDDTPVDPIKWFVVFYDDNDGYSATINPHSGEVITLEEFSGVKATFSKDVEKAKAEKEKLYHKTIYSIYD